MVWYLDTSAFLKLVVAQEESQAMRAWFASHGPCWSSQLLRTEAYRAAIRLEIDQGIIIEALDAVTLILPSVATFLSAAKLDPPGLHSLDALHLAAALELGNDLEGVVTYDARMAEGVRNASIQVVGPC